MKTDKNKLANIFYSLDNAEANIRALECHCDDYNGFACRIHKWAREIEHIKKEVVEAVEWANEND